MPERHHPRAAFQHADFRRFQLARFVLTLAIQFQSVAVAWQVYALTDRPIDLGWVGLAQFAPLAALSLVGGHVADRFDRVHVLVTAVAAIACCAALLGLLALTGAGVAPIYAVIVLFGAARAFAGPASAALLTHLVPKEHFANAVAWNSTTWQIGAIVGPALAGLLYALLGGPAGVYATSAGLSVLAVCVVWSLSARPGRLDRKAVSLETLLGGIRYVRDTRVVLGAISLDLFAVLLGGAVALLPVYAKDVLHTGPWGLGLLRAAPGVGALAMAVGLAYRPLERRAGATMLGAVAVFGLATLVFGLSESFLLSLLALALVGASDMVSVVVRQTLIQLHTPADMRGRVSAVSQVFIGASNELGEFESGVTAQLFGAVRAVTLGGVGTLAVAGLWTWMFPALRAVDRLEDAPDHARARATQPTAR